MEKKLRIADLPIPRTAEGVIALVKRISELSSVMEVRITPSGVSVTRAMASEDDPVVPEVDNAADDPDFDFILEHVELVQAPFCCIQFPTLFLGCVSLDHVILLFYPNLIFSNHHSV
mgnify:CR=1 FL=1